MAKVRPGSARRANSASQRAQSNKRHGYPKSRKRNKGLGLRTCHSTPRPRSRAGNSFCARTGLFTVSRRCRRGAPGNNSNQNEHMNKQVLLLTLALGVATCLLSAQDGNQPPGGKRPPGGKGGPGGQGGPGNERRGPGGPGGMGSQRPVSPIVAALDLNHDGIIDAEEIAKASESLKKLDKNGDGKLTPDEYMPPRPGGPGGQGGPGGPAGKGGRGGPGGQGAPGGKGGPRAGGGANGGGEDQPKRPASE
jgi:hypothetical protein